MKPPEGKELHLVRGRWYGWEMLPGYGELFSPYFSPIFVQVVLPKKTGHRRLRVSFVNIGYAEGVQDFELDLRVLEHQRGYMIVSLEYGPEGPQDRCAVISELNHVWLNRFCPQHIGQRPLAAGADISQYLNDVFSDQVSVWLDDKPPS